MRLAAVAFGIYLVASIVGQQLEIREKKALLANVQQQCQTQEMENMEVQRLLSQGDDRSYVEKVARDKLDYAYPDEKVFVDASGS
ncbi:FtsB family cell division protein [Zongyangia hominis]|uniref:Septum formation initiator family protein n=1 Tax=Zongyangia hominis TaxID=2763677 RepID=A0A926ED92_9FIRM|nr:septum formation initiator family protein [Zongyangia hominis]MBC8569801.1 septum formation initiator family protein [Zongyangia hominis]